MTRNGDQIQGDIVEDQQLILVELVDGGLELQVSARRL
jgi:hypothetical protein